MKVKVPLSNPDITEHERKAVLDVLNTPNLSLGPKLAEFEELMARYAGVKHAAAMSSGTAVLHCIVKGLGIAKGDYVLTTPFSFVATSNCLLYEGAEPIFVDIDENTYNITPENVERVYLSLPAAKKKRVKGVVYVDVFGVPADGYGFEELGKKYGFHIIEDSAEALGSSQKGRKCGSFGEAGLFAFYPNKQITTGEGGMLVTDNDELAALAKSLRNQGRDTGAGWLQHARLGYNYRISDINCALGIAQMRRIQEIIDKRRKVKKIYDTKFQPLFTNTLQNALKKTKFSRLVSDMAHEQTLLGWGCHPLFEKGWLVPQHVPEDCFLSPFVYVLRLADRFDQKNRNNLLEHLREKGIQCSNYFTPIHLQPPYRELGWKEGDMPITEKVADRTMALPFFTNLEEEQITYVVKAVNAFFSST